MGKDIKTEILIRATPAKVWAVFSSFNRYPEWNPFIRSLEGNVQVGNTITVQIQPPDSKAMTFKPKVLVMEPDKSLQWLGKLWIKGLFDGRHQFELIDNGDGSTTFKQSEHFSGILVWMLNLENTKKGFESMNAKLKELAEKG